VCIAIYGNPSHNYGVSLAVWDHTVLPSTRHKWTHHTFTRARQAGTRFTNHLRMEGWVSPSPGCKEQLAHSCYKYPITQCQCHSNPTQSGITKSDRYFSTVCCLLCNSLCYISIVVVGHDVLRPGRDSVSFATWARLVVRTSLLTDEDTSATSSVEGFSIDLLLLYS